MAYTQQEIDYLKWLNNSMLTQGEPAGNPGFSFAAPTYSTQSYNAGTGQVTGGYNAGELTGAGATWVGQDGGDTAANRGLFESYLSNSTIAKPTNLNYLSPQATGQMQQTAPQGHQYTPEEIAYLTSLNQPAATAPVENNDLANFMKWANDNQFTYTRTDDKGKLLFGTADGLETVGRLANGLTPYENAEAQRTGLLTGRDDGTKKSEIQDFYQSYATLLRNDPEGFQRLAAQDPQMATRFFALTRGQRITDRQGNVIPQQVLDALHNSILSNAGIDMKEDGKVYTTDYRTVDDANSQWGGGDFWKTGGMSTISNNGPMSDVLNSPLTQIAAYVAAPFTSGASVAALEAARVASGNKDFSIADTAMALLPAGLSALQSSGMLQSGMTAMRTPDSSIINNLADIASSGLDGAAKTPGLVDAASGAVSGAIGVDDWSANQRGGKRGPTQVESLFKDYMPIEGPTIGNTQVGSRPGWHWERNPDPEAIAPWIAVKDAPSPAGGGGGTSGSGSPQQGGGNPASPGGDSGAPGTPVGDPWVRQSDGTYKNSIDGRVISGETYGNITQEGGGPPDSEEVGLEDILGVLAGLGGIFGGDVFGDTTAGGSTGGSDSGTGGSGGSTGGSTGGSGGDSGTGGGDGTGSGGDGSEGSTGGSGGTDGTGGTGGGTGGGDGTGSGDGTGDGDGDGEGEGDGDGETPGAGTQTASQYEGLFKDLFPYTKLSRKQRGQLIPLLDQVMALKQGRK